MLFAMNYISGFTVNRSSFAKSFGFELNTVISTLPRVLFALRMSQWPRRAKPTHAAIRRMTPGSRGAAPQPRVRRQR